MLRNDERYLKNISKYLKNMKKHFKKSNMTQPQTKILVLQNERRSNLLRKETKGIRKNLRKKEAVYNF